MVILQGRFGIGRFGATRFGFYNPNLIVIASYPLHRSDFARSIVLDTLEIHTDIKQPAKATFTAREAMPVPTIVAGENGLVIALGADQDGARLFTGAITDVEQDQEQTDRAIEYPSTALGEMADLDAVFVSGTYADTSISDIAIDIIRQVNLSAIKNFTTRGVQSGLATLDTIAFTNVRPSTALARLAAYVANSRWYFQDGDLHFVTTEAVTMPQDLTAGNTHFWNLKVRTSRGQVRTRIRIEGQSTSIVLSTPDGAEIDELPVADPTQLEPITGPNLQIKIEQQILDYSYVGYGGSDPPTGANVPGTTVSSDTAAGATTLPVADISQVSSSGWAQIGSQFIRYNGASAGNLTGIPASGYGSLAIAVKSGTQVSAVGFVILSASITFDPTLPRDTAVTQHVVVEDLTAQASQGIREVLIQDGSLGYAAAVIRANAELANFKAPVTMITYTTRDPRTIVGRTVTYLGNAYTIRTVRIYGFDQRAPITVHKQTAFPLRDVEAAPVGFMDAIDVLATGDNNF